MFERAVVGVGTGGLETKGEAGVKVEGSATVGVMGEFVLNVKAGANAEVQLDGWKGVGVVTL